MNAATIERWTIRESLILAAIVVVCAGFRFVDLDGLSVWTDEMTTMTIALQRTPAGMATQVQTVDASRALFHPFVLHFWIELFGRSLLAMRALSALAGTLSVVLIYLLGRSMLGVRAAAWSAWLLALSPIDLYHAREVRMYSLLVLVTVACWSLVWSLRRSPALLKQAAYIACGIALEYCHPLGVFMLVPLFLVMLAQSRESGQGIVRVLLLHLVIGAALLPWIVHYFDHKPEALTTEHSYRVYLTWPEMFTGGGIWGALVGVVLVGIGLRAHFRAGAITRIIRSLDDSTKTLIAWFAIPTLLLLAYSLVAHPLFGQRRYLLFVGPAYLMLVAKGLCALPARPRWAVAGLLTYLAVSCYPGRVYKNALRPDWKSVARIIQQNDPGANIVIDPMNMPAYGCLGFYLDKTPTIAPGRFTWKTFELPRTPATSTGWFARIGWLPPGKRRHAGFEIEADHIWSVTNVTLYHGQLRPVSAITRRSDGSRERR